MIVYRIFDEERQLWCGTGLKPVSGAGKIWLHAGHARNALHSWRVAVRSAGLNTYTIHMCEVEVLATMGAKEFQAGVNFEIGEE